MRITGGTAKGHSLKGPGKKNHGLRPTTDRVREAVFNILAERLAGARVLDLFAGTGSYGLEALSRGAESVVFVDRDRTALEIIAHNLRHCFPDARARAFQLDLKKSSSLARLQARLPAESCFDLVFLDPPYEKNLAKRMLEMVEDSELITGDGIVLVEEKKNQLLPNHLKRLKLLDNRSYGETGIWLYVSDQGHRIFARSRLSA